MGVVYSQDIDKEWGNLMVSKILRSNFPYILIVPKEYEIGETDGKKRCNWTGMEVHTQGISGNSSAAYILHSAADMIAEEEEKDDGPKGTP